MGSQPIYKRNMVKDISTWLKTQGVFTASNAVIEFTKSASIEEVKPTGIEKGAVWDECLIIDALIGVEPVIIAITSQTAPFSIPVGLTSSIDALLVNSITAFEAVNTP
jgi:hypothetical protein